MIYFNDMYVSSHAPAFTGPLCMHHLDAWNNLVSFAIIFIATRNIPHAVSELTIDASYGSTFSS